MRILLLSRNRVVQELVRLGLREIDGAELEIVNGAQGPASDHYDVILEEDRFLEGFGEIGIDHLLAGRRLLLGDPSLLPEESRFDAVIPKPFLPADIQKALRLKPIEENRPERENIRDFLEEEGVTPEESTEILDEEEIFRIRRLLEGEIDEPVAQMQSEAAEQTIDAETFLELVERFRSKKLKKLLRGATIRLTIEFPEEEL
ncbi:hypothetical protein [Nitratifractor sp.]|uniref:hypothetical protein n=1 Tax=Nitratifractor sp. TaxID=2268144 RepID=UPI0025E48E6D|nr:hypothetical protein [Nitratifractor sp.]